MWPFKKRETIDYYTVDTHELAPYPNMTSEELRDFEHFAEEITGIKLRR